MNYAQLAKEFGGVAAQPSTTQQPDFAALAKEFGGSLAPTEAAPKQEVNYAALAQQFGGALEGKPGSRGSFELLGAGTEAGVTGLQSMYEGVSLLRNVAAVDRITSSLATYDAIDKGEIKSAAQASQKGLNATSAAKYLRATPEARVQMRENQFANEGERRALIGDSIRLFQQYQKEMAAKGKGVPNFTDIESMDGFRQWLTFNLPSAAIQLAPIMVAAITTGGAGAFALGGAMGVGETVGNRLEFILDKVKNLSPEEQANKIEEYVRSTRDTTMAVGLASGALDLAGPVRSILRNRAKKEGAKYLTKREALKAGVKEAPRAIGEEALTGAGQETIQILGEKKLGEMEEDLISKKNFKRIADASALEALGGKVGAAINTGIQVTDTGLRQRAERLQQEEVDRLLRQTAVAAKAATLNPEYAKLVEKYLAEGKSQAEAFQLAGAELSEREVESEPTKPATGGVEPSPAVPSGQGVPGAATVSSEETAGGRLEPTGVGVGGTAARTEPVLPALTTEEITQRYTPEIAEAITNRANQLVEDGAALPIALQAAEAEVTEGLPEAEILAPPPIVEPVTPVTAVTDSNVEPVIDAETIDEAINQLATTADATGLNVDTPEDVSQINPETGLKPAGKRGRKKIERTPEQQAEYETQRRAAQAAGRDAGRTVDKAEKTLDTPFDEGAFESETALSQGRQARFEETVNALTDLFRIVNNPSFRKNKPGLRARQLIDRFPPNSRERVVAEARSKLGTQQASFAFGLEESTNSNINSELEQFSNTGDVLRYIIKTGNAFEKLLAQRILPFVKNVPIVFLPDVASGVDAKDRSKAANATGLYVGLGGGKGTIFISNDPNNDGRNNMTILHEALHGATVARITAFLTNPNSVSGSTRQAMVELFETMIAAGEFYNVIKSQAEANPAIANKFNRLLRNADFFASKGVFSNVAEFIAYGMSQPEFQEFLVQVPGRFRKGNALYKNLFTRFVNSIRNIFNLGPEHHSAFQDLVIVSDKLLRSPELIISGDAEVLAAAKPPTAKQVRKATTKKKKVDKTTLKIFLSNKYSDLASSVGDLMMEVRNSKDALSLLNSIYGALSVGSIRKLLPTLTTQDITRWAGDRIANIRNVNSSVQEMAGMRAKMIRELAQKVPAWVKLAKNNEAGGRLLGDVMHRATLDQVDPSKYGSLNDALQNDPVIQAETVKSTDPNLTPRQRAYHLGQKTKRENDFKAIFPMWDKLGSITNGEGHSIYRMAKQTYLDTFNLHQNILIDKITVSSVPGDVNDASTPKGRLMASITKSFQDAASMEIYFPLMRYGNYWFRVGKGKGGEFYMFESATARNNAVQKRVEELQKAGDTRSFEQMVEDLDIDFGDDLRQMRAEIVESSDMLKNIFKMLDDPKNKFTDIEALKDQVYQMYLMTLPEKDIRKRFTHRQGKTGFSADVIRNFIVSQHTAANQLSRLKYSDDIRNAIGAAYAELAGNPDKLKLNAFVDEIAMRAGGEMAPSISGEFNFDKLASLGNQAVFYYMLTSMKSALVQMTQLPVVGLPVLLAKYDSTAVVRTVGRYSFLFNKLGTTKRDAQGNITTKWGQPSINDSRYVNKHPDLNYRRILKDAWEYGNDQDLFMATYTADMTSRARVPTGEFEGWFTKGRRGLANLMGGAFHHTERISRETMYMASFELEFAKQKKAGKSNAEAAAIAKKEAVNTVYESLFNYTQYNKPRVMKTPAGRIATQFLSYPLQVTSYLIRNFYGMLPFLNKEGKKEAATMFFGTLLMTGMFAGVVGMPLYSLICGMIDAYRELMRPEEDEDYDEDDEGNPLGYRSIDLYFRETFLPSIFGRGSSIAEALGLTDEQADTLARAVKYGPITAYTNLNIGASVSLDGLWFRDDTPANDAKSAVQEMFFNLFGGPLGSGVVQIASGFEDINNGQLERGIEKLLPAFFRGSMKAYRLSVEGLKTTKGDEVMNAEYYTTGRLIAQAMGFDTAEVAEVQKANFMAKRLESQITKERQSLLNKLDIAVRRAEDRGTEAAEEKIEEVLDDIDKYNVKNGFGPFLINQKTIETSLTGREKRRGESYQGLSVDKKAAPFIEPLIERSRSPEYR